MKDSQSHLKVNQNFPKTYSEKDSSLMFVLALFLPYVVYFVFSVTVMLFFNNTAFEKEVLFGVTGNYISTILCQVSLIGAAWVLTKRKKLNLFKANNFSFKLDYVKVILVIVIGAVALFGFNWFSDMFAYVLSLIGYKTTPNTLVNYGVTNIGMLLLCLVVLAVLPALCEEISMRGVILNGFNKKSKNFAIFVSALMFMIMHLGLEQCIYQFVLGVVLATIVYYSGNILYSIILHLFNNALVLILNYISSKSITPQSFVRFTDYLWPVLVAGATLLIVYYLIKLFKLRCIKTGSVNLSEKNKISQEETCLSQESNSLKQQPLNTGTNQTVRDLPKPKLEILTGKTALIISLSVGILMWLVVILTKFIV